MRLRCATAIFLIATAACGDDDDDTTTAETEPAAVVEEVGETETGTAPAPEAPDEGAALVDLMRDHGATIEVSSSTGPRHHPRRLYDDTPNTAWCSKTGNLVGAFIRIGFPGRVSVSQIQMVVGYDRELDGRDLFEENQRVARVELLSGESREEVPTRTIDSDVRTLQPLFETEDPLRTNVLTLRVAETTPGTVTRFREVCITDLRVMGSGEGYAGRPTVALQGVRARLVGTDDSLTLAEVQNPVRVANTNLRTVQAPTPRLEQTLGETVGAPVEVVARVDRRSENGDRAVWVVATHSPEAVWRRLREVDGTLEAQLTRINAAYDRCLEEHEEEFGGNYCNRVHPYPSGSIVSAWRVSFPKHGEPAVDARVNLGTTHEEGYLRLSAGIERTAPAWGELSLSDVDRDDRDELVLRLITAGPVECVIGGPTIEQLLILDPETLARTNRLELSHRYDMMMYEDHVSLYAFRDETGDGRPDLVVRSASYIGSQCSLDERPWPEEGRRVNTLPDLDDVDFADLEDRGCEYVVSRSIMEWDETTDRFVGDD